MLSKLEGIINGISLTLTQWILLAMAGIIGMLLVALKLQGSKLHKAQVQILTQHLHTVDMGDENAVKTSRDRFNKAYQEYKDAK